MLLDRLADLQPLSGTTEAQLLGQDHEALDLQSLQYQSNSSCHELGRRQEQPPPLTQTQRSLSPVGIALSPFLLKLTERVAVTEVPEELVGHFLHQIAEVQRFDPFTR